jgi:hypothetical protein
MEGGEEKKRDGNIPHYHFDHRGVNVYHMLPQQLKMHPNASFAHGELLGLLTIWWYFMENLV